MERDTLCRLMCGWLAWPYRAGDHKDGAINSARGVRLFSTADELRFVRLGDGCAVVADADGLLWRAPADWLVPIDLEDEEQSAANVPEPVDRHGATA